MRAQLITHPLWLRLCHWLNALAFLVMVTSGWRIYDASPFLGFRIPAALTLGGWLGGGLLWHFAAMWVLVANGLVYLGANLASGRLFQRFLPVSPQGVLRDTFDAMRGRLAHADLGHYNQVQKFLYLFTLFDLLVLVLSGLVLWKSVQFPLLRDLMGGYEWARRVHFAAMAGACAFLLLHIVMTVLFPSTLRAMLRGA